MTTEPIANGENGRGADGRFQPGNAGGPGNPFARRTAELRRTLLGAVSDDDLRAIVAKLVERAKTGDMAAIREVLDRLIGKPGESANPDHIDRQSRTLAEGEARRAGLMHREIENLSDGELMARLRRLKPERYGTG